MQSFQRLVKQHHTISTNKLLFVNSLFFLLQSSPSAYAIPSVTYPSKLQTACRRLDSEMTLCGNVFVDIAAVWKSPELQHS